MLSRHAIRWRGTVLRLAEELGELLDDGDRAVVAARAADREGYLAAAVAFEAGHDESGEADDVVDELGGVGLAVDELSDRGIGAPFALQVWDEEGVREEAHVEQIVGFARGAVLEAEALEPEVDALRRREAEGVLDAATQRVDGVFGRVEDVRRVSVNGLEELALGQDAVFYGAVALKGVVAAGLALPAGSTHSPPMKNFSYVCMCFPLWEQRRSRCVRSSVNSIVVGSV